MNDINDAGCFDYTIHSILGVLFDYQGDIFELLAINNLRVNAFFLLYS